MHNYRLGCDIGGTFTDFVLYDRERGHFSTRKVLTTPDDPSEAVETGVVQFDTERPGYVESTDYMIHGTTLVINALIERKGARTGLITSRGFRDIVEMRREIRYDIYDIGAIYPTPLIPRQYRHEVDERVLASGDVWIPLDEASVTRALDALAAQGVEAVAVCLLHAYANPTHERRIAEIAAARHPGLSLSLSSDVLPEIKEYVRSTTTAANAYVKPMAGRYINQLGERLTRRGLHGGLYLMLSGGGIMSPQTAVQFPVRLIESGPVGGALAAAHLGRAAGMGDLVAFDMGGTTAKACIVENGIPIATSEYEVDRVHRFKKGSGTPLGVPTVDVIEIGAGGGSIASINQLGLLQVGPHSAGAKPGPICYGRGGAEPTVTDADLVLGYLDPDYFLGGEMRLDVKGARAGIDSVIGAALDLSTLEAAWAIHEVVNENMASAIRMYAAEKGVDLTRTAVVAYGGAGPGHADDCARRLGCSRVIVPRGAGVFSAVGFLVAPVSYEVARTHVGDLASTSEAALAEIYARLEREAAALVSEASPESTLEFHRAADMRYLGQGATVRVRLGDSLAASTLAELFKAEYRKRYGIAYDDIAIQLVTPRVSAFASVDVPAAIMPFTSDAADAAAAHKGSRLAYSPQDRKMRPHEIYAMDRLASGVQITGPAIIEESSSTLVLGEGALATVDGRGWLSVTFEKGGR